MIVLDACMIISFGSAGVLSLIDELQLDNVAVSARARAEVERDPARAAMEASIAAGRLSVVRIDLDIPAEQDALRDFDARTAFRGRGEAEVLALAMTRGYGLASDERAVRAAARKHLDPTRIAGTADFIAWAVREGRLKASDAEGVLGQLDSGAAVLAKLQRQGRALIDIIGDTNA